MSGCPGQPEKVLGNQTWWYEGRDSVKLISVSQVTGNVPIILSVGDVRPPTGGVRPGLTTRRIFFFFF